MSTDHHWPQDLDDFDWWSMAHECWNGARMKNPHDPVPDVQMMLKRYPQKKEEEAVAAARLMGKMRQDIFDVVAAGRFRRSVVTTDLEASLDWAAFEDYLVNRYPLVSNHGFRKCMRDTIFNSFVR